MSTKLFNNKIQPMSAVDAIDVIQSAGSSDMKPQDDQDKRCAPGVKFEAGSCIRLQILIEMAKAYNEEVGDGSPDQIKFYTDVAILNPPKYKEYLVAELTSRTGNKCTSQKCWTSQEFISRMKEASRAELEKYTWRTDGPQGRFEWLNTLNIDDVMEQYELKHPDFTFLGAVPIDFNDFERYGIKNLNFKQLVERGKTKIGVIFNLDKHNESGSHWVAGYADLKLGVYFFDSYGVPPAPEIRKFMRRVEAFCKTGMGIKNVAVEINKEQHQRENSECGVYSINFIVRMLGGKSFKEIERSKIPDKKINKCRKVYFGNAKF
jgi:hypothetical protein